jgi:hypothetical protein
MARDAGDRHTMLCDVKEEKVRAKELFHAMNKLPEIGYEAANHYYYNKGMLAEKVISCDYLESRFEK